MNRALFASAVVLAMIGVACSGGDDGQEEVGLATLATTAGDASATTDGVAADDGGDAEAALIEFAKCVRENGFPEYPDLTLNPDGTIGFGGLLGQLEDSGIDPQSEEFLAVVEICSDRLEGVALGLLGEGFDQAELQDTLLAFAECMRNQGISIDDPDLSDFGAAIGDGPFANLDFNDPQVRTALLICQREVTIPGLGGSSTPDEGSTDE